MKWEASSALLSSRPSYAAVGGRHGQHLHTHLERDFIVVVVAAAAAMAMRSARGEDEGCGPTRRSEYEFQRREVK
jgi:hypothetical protein